MNRKSFFFFLPPLINKKVLANEFPLAVYLHSVLKKQRSATDSYTSKVCGSVFMHMRVRMSRFLRLCMCVFMCGWVHVRVYECACLHLRVPVSSNPCVREGGANLISQLLRQLHLHHQPAIPTAAMPCARVSACMRDSFRQWIPGNFMSTDLLVNTTHSDEKGYGLVGLWFRQTCWQPWLKETRG